MASSMNVVCPVCTVRPSALTTPVVRGLWKPKGLAIDAHVYSFFVRQLGRWRGRRSGLHRGGQSLSVACLPRAPACSGPVCRQRRHRNQHYQAEAVSKVLGWCHGDFPFGLWRAFCCGPLPCPCVVFLCRIGGELLELGDQALYLPPGGFERTRAVDLVLGHAALLLHLHLCSDAPLGLVARHSASQQPLDLLLGLAPDHDQAIESTVV